MPAKDPSRWTEIPGDHANDIAYSRLGALLNTNIDATPSARQAAKELGINLAAVTGTGADGRITKADVEAAADA